jgi:hypothetical protein
LFIDVFLWVGVFHDPVPRLGVGID